MTFVLLSVVVQLPTVRALPDVPVTGGNEPYATVANPLNPANVIVAQCSLFISTDFGQNFAAGVFPGTPAGYPFLGRGCDDSLAFDSQGRLFWSYLLRGDFDGDGNRDDLTVVVQQVNPTTGALIGAAADITPGQFTDDKPWIAADSNPASPFSDNLYIVWSRLDGGSFVMFSRSLNQGAAWSGPTAVSIASEDFAWPSHVAVAPNGDAYVSYHADTCDTDGTGGTIQVIRDSTGGANLQAGTITQKTAAFTDGQATISCNRQDAGGPFGTIPQAIFWTQGAAAPYVLPDPLIPGRIYVVSNDDPNDDFTTGDPGDVVLSTSTDNGNSWSVTTISHGPEGTLQVFPNGAIDQAGNLVVFWYDTRQGATNSAGNFLLDVFATVSRDGGATFTNDFRVNDAAFDPDAGAPCRYGPSPNCGTTTGGGTPFTLRIGEYNGIAAANGIAYVAWTGNDVAPPLATSQQIFFDVFSILGAFPDRFEPNDAINMGIATDLGSGSFYNEPGLTIHTVTDEDFFKVVTLDTGKLSFEVESNGRVADLDIQVQDKFGVAVANVAGGLDSRNTERLTIPAVQGEPYFLRVFAQAGQNSPINTYSLTITNTPAPVPFEIDLIPSSDSGRDPADDVTNIDMPTVRLRLDDADFLAEGISLSPTPDSTLTNDAPGFKVRILTDGNSAGFATSVGGQPGVYQFSFPSPLVDGLHSVTARVVIVDPSDDPAVGGTSHVVGNGAESDSLAVAVDTTAPVAPPAPDLLASSDSAGIDDDNITTIRTPEFAGTGEANSRVHISANGVVVGEVAITPFGTYEVTVIPMADGVYDIMVRLEDSAGNLGSASAALRVTIAHDILNLPGMTAGPPVSPVTVDLGAGTIAGYPGVAGATGLIGIQGIPVVNLDVNGQSVTILGSSGDDDLTFSPTGSGSGTLTRALSSQVLNLSGVGGTLTIDPLAGNDKVTVNGTRDPDTITIQVNTDTVVSVNSLLPVHVPITNVELLVVRSGEGSDTIKVTTFNTVSAHLLVDGGSPTSTTTPRGDQLDIKDGSGRARIRKQPGGAVPDSGIVIVEYVRTTGTTIIIEYVDVERTQKNADVNGDGVVDLADLVEVFRHMYQTGMDSPYDLDIDGDIDIDDLTIVRRSQFSTVPS